jgi:hypothetical protein
MKMLYNLSLSIEKLLLDNYYFLVLTIWFIKEGGFDNSEFLRQVKSSQKLFLQKIESNFSKRSFWQHTK